MSTNRRTLRRRLSLDEFQIAELLSGRTPLLGGYGFARDVQGIRLGWQIAWPATDAALARRLEADVQGRQRTPPFTPRVLELFRTMESARVRCTCAPIDWETPDGYWKDTGEECPACRRWWKAHNELHNLLDLRPWEWPAFEHPDDVSPYPRGCAADRET